MISFDDHPPSDPNSSSHHQHHQQQQLSHDLKLSDTDLKFLDDINNNQLPKFSIRDYVFGLRSKDIASNWPFSPTSLQLCLKHGVKNLLPPFQSLESLRNNSSLTKTSLENRLTDEELINSFDGKPTNEQFKPNEKLVLKSIATISSGLKGQRSKDKPSPSSQKPENASCHIKKSRLVMKLNSGVEQRVEDTTPLSFIVSETMASKICPVCKTFSSSSNTTLNAHIDQCLTGEGTMKWTDHNPKQVIVKHKVKPRKMRLMVDIYKTAPHCTIEELDRRNGTSWATNSNFPAQEFQFQGEEEENTDPKPTTNNHTVADNEGDVYIDTNGTKVRILSVPKADSSNNHGARKLVKGVKGSKFIMGKKKNNSFKQKHQQKYLKVGPNAKKLCSSKIKAKNDQEEDVVMTENCNKDEHEKEPKKVTDLGIIRPPWACSKRTLFSKKFIDKNRKVELPTNDLVIGRVDKSSPNRKKMETSSLVKQPLKKLARMRDDDDDDDDNDNDDDDYDYDDDDDSQDACPSQHSDDVDIRSKGKKLSSLTRNLSLPAAKFGLKRKFSSVEKSWVKSVDGSSQDSLQEQSRTEEHVVSNKNQDSRSITSKSLSNEESSVGVQAIDVESVRNETLLSVQSIQTPSFIGLTTSFDPDFSKQDCIEMYQDPICSTNRAPNDVEKHENYFQEVEPIPIPGPPGSFLPASPGGEMVSEEQVQATTVDQDSMSNSPVSTVSNSRSTSVQDDAYKKSFFSNDTGFTEKGQSRNGFKNDQPCCCSRKEVALNYQDSYTLRKQPIESNRNTPISGFNFKSEMFSLSKYPTSQAPETASFPTNKKLAVSGDCDSTGSPSKPVLRLMGKNLTVVKSDEDEFRPPQSSQQHPQRPVIFSQYQNGFESQNMRSHFDSRPIYDGFMAPLDRYGRGGAYMGHNMPQTRPHHGHNVHDFQPVIGRNVYNNASSSKPNKEIIIIDDSPENEDDDSMRNEFSNRNQVQMNPLYTMYPPQISSHHPYNGGGSGGSTVFRGGGYQTSMANEDLSKWNIQSSSPSMSNLRSSTIYYPPNYP